MGNYLTISGPARAKHTEKMSRFLSFAYPAESIEEARGHISELQREYCDARHVCWAWVIGTGNAPHAYSNDNGEPSGTAGKPILGQINSRGLRNVVVGVVRYFGGIKLGTPGLIAAYKLAAQLALDEAEIVERTEMDEIAFTFGYEDMNAVMQVAKLPGIETASRSFDNTCAMTLKVAATEAASISRRLSAIGSVSIVNP